MGPFLLPSKVGATSLAIKRNEIQELLALLTFVNIEALLQYSVHKPNQFKQSLV